MHTITPAIQNNTIYIWQACLNDPPLEKSFLQNVLSPDEHERAGKFQFEKDSRHFIVRRGLLRWLLGCVCGQAPQSIQFTENEFGKPGLHGPSAAEISFNISHSGSQAVFAVSRHRAVGVDIECLRPFEHADQIVDDFFSEQEKVEFRALAPEYKQTAFFSCWTQKEAYTKARGQGLSYPWNAFSTSFLPGSRPVMIPVREGEKNQLGWYLQRLESPSGTIAMVAAEGEDWIVRYCNWPQPIRRQQHAGFQSSDQIPQGHPVEI